MTENNEKVEVKDVVEVEVKDNGLALVYYNVEDYNKNILNDMKKDMQKVLSGVDFKDPVLNSAFHKASGEILMELLGK